VGQRRKEGRHREVEMEWRTKRKRRGVYTNKAGRFLLSVGHQLTIRTSPPPRIRGIASAWTSVGSLSNNRACQQLSNKSMMS
jgi:hypothetical protein